MSSTDKSAKREVRMIVSKAPDDPKEKKEWVKQMMRIQFGIYVNEHATCEHCGHTYTSVDDMLRANPVRGHTEKMSFVCAVCYPEYKKDHPLPADISSTKEARK